MSHDATFNGVTEVISRFPRTFCSFSSASRCDIIADIHTFLRSTVEA